MLTDLIRSIIAYVIFMTVLKGLVTGKGFAEILRFAGGLILILLMVIPIARILNQDIKWKQIIEEKMFRQDIEEFRQEMNLSEEHLQRIVLKKMKRRMKSQIKQKARTEKLSVRRVWVSIVKTKKKGWCVTGIEINLNQNGFENDFFATQEKNESGKRVSELRKWIARKYHLQESYITIY